MNCFWFLSSFNCELNVNCATNAIAHAFDLHPSTMKAARSTLNFLSFIIIIIIVIIVIIIIIIIIIILIIIIKVVHTVADTGVKMVRIACSKCVSALYTGLQLPSFVIGVEILKVTVISFSRRKTDNNYCEC